MTEPSCVTSEPKALRDRWERDSQQRIAYGNVKRAVLEDLRVGDGVDGQ